MQILRLERRSNPGLAILSFLALVFVVPVVFFELTTGDFVYFPYAWTRGSPGPEAFLVLVLTSFGLVQATHSKQFSIVRIPFFVFMYTFFCVVPCYQFYLGSTSSFITVGFHREHYENGLLLSSVALIFYMLGNFVGSRQRPKNYTFIVPQVNSRILCIVCALLAIFSMAVQIVLVGGDLSGFFVDRIQYSWLFESDGSSVVFLVVTSLIRVPPFIALALLVNLYLENSSAASRSLVITSMFICLPLFVLCNFPTAIPRLWLGSMIIAFLVIYFRYSKSNSGVRFGVITLFAVLIAFPIAGVLRNFFLIEDELLTLDYSKVILSSYTEGQFDTFQMLLSIMYYVDMIGLTYGNQLLSAILFWVPRQIFPGKGVSTGTFVGQELEFLYLNVSSPFIGEMYIDFGTFGVIVGMFFYGFLSYRIESKFHQGGYSSVFTVFIAFMSGWQFILLRGSAMVALSFLGPCLLLAWGLKIWLFRGSPLTTSRKQTTRRR